MKPTLCYSKVLQVLDKRPITKDNKCRSKSGFGIIPSFRDSYAIQQEYSFPTIFNNCKLKITRLFIISIQLTTGEYGKLCFLGLIDTLFVNDNLIVIPTEPS
jgi:hypothetical protein